MQVLVAEGEATADAAARLFPEHVVISWANGTNAIAKAEVDESTLRWFEVLETRGHIENGKIAHWQVRVKIGATLAD